MAFSCKHRGWAQRLKRVVGIDVSTCVYCGGAVRIVASIEETAAIRAILGYFEKHGALATAHDRPGSRGHPLRRRAAAAIVRGAADIKAQGPTTVFPTAQVMHIKKVLEEVQARAAA